MWNFYASVSVKKSEIVIYIPPMYLVRIRENPKKEQKYENWWNCKWLYHLYDEEYNNIFTKTNNMYMYIVEV